MFQTKNVENVFIENHVITLLFFETFDILLSFGHAVVTDEVCQ